MLDLERVHGGALRDDFLQKRAKSWNVPLTVAERVERPTQDVLAVNLRSTHGDDDQASAGTRDQLDESLVRGDCEGMGRICHRGFFQSASPAAR
jgi:hypothetical protein